MPDAHEAHAKPAELANGVIPMLDVSRYLAGDRSELDRLGRELRYAFERVGFYYLRGHDVPQTLIDAMFAEAERFHAQPVERKLALRIKVDIGVSRKVPKW